MHRACNARPLQAASAMPGHRCTCWHAGAAAGACNAWDELRRVAKRMRCRHMVGQGMRCVGMRTTMAVSRFMHLSQIRDIGCRLVTAVLSQQHVRGGRFVWHAQR
eukprot:355369-Chlamydomonas_euryale.AAC.14